MARVNQLDLPLGASTQRVTGEPEPGAVHHPFAALSLRSDAELAERLPPYVHLGALDWVNPTWELWPEPATPVSLERDGLYLYSQQPLFRCVRLGPRDGVFPTERELVRYVAQLPRGFPCVIELPAELSTPRYQRKRGALHGPGGAMNPTFLSADFAATEILRPLLHACREHLGPVVLRCSGLAEAGLRPGPFAERLHGFLAALPRELSYAVELCEPTFLTLDYAWALADLAVSHVLTSAPGMPRFSAQVMAVPTSPERIAWLDTPLSPALPYATDEARRRDLLDALVAGPSAPRPIYVLAADAAEGHAPATLRAMGTRLAQALGS